MKRVSVLLLVIICILCTGCNGTVTRNIRHAGFNVNGTFKCSRFFAQSKDEVASEKIAYLTTNNIINTEGKIYEVSLSQPYVNKENCKEANTSIRVKAIMNDTIVKGMDGNYYYLTTQNNVERYSKIPVTDNSYLIYDILLKGDDVVKVVTANGSTGLYYVLKTDGNVYGNVVSTKDYNSPPQLMSTMIVYSKSQYGARIIDFNYAGDSLATFIKTEDKVYRMRISNSKECMKYADVDCIYEMKEDSMFDEYKDRIIAYNGALLITDYKQMFAVAS